MKPCHRSNSTPSMRKRTHLKPSQVAVLQESFVSNPLPDAHIRSRLAVELGVTERTIQIWFQNRRAKARKLETQCGGGIPALMPNVCTGWIEPPSKNNPTSVPPRFQATFRSMMTPERFEEMQQQEDTEIRRRPRSSSKPEPRVEDLIQTPTRAMSEGADRVPQQVSFSVSTLRIGTWARFARAATEQRQDEWDLMCYAQPQHRQLIWQVQDGGHQFRVLVALDAVRQVRLGQVQTDATNWIGQLEFDVDPLVAPVSFSMWRSGIDHDWVQCGDFTEQKQASHDGIHTLQGNHDLLRQALLELISQAPDMASKLVLVPSDAVSVADDALCREMTLSPSATPEPAAFMQFPSAMDLKSFEQPPSFYPQVPIVDMTTDPQSLPWYYLQMMQPSSFAPPMFM